MATEFPIRANVNPAVQDVNKLIASLRSAGKEAGMTEKEIDDMADSVKKAGTQGPQHIGKINASFNNLVNDGMKKVGAALLAIFALEQIKAFGREIITITSEFQKYNAVLKNTLNSQALTNVEMAKLILLAAKTNFSLQEVTQGYIKLLNNGIKPTQKELEAFFDLTNNAGKGFDQFVEAVNDATRGEFERLKEFFIAAHKHGDEVTFTFKNQTFEAKNNAQSIKDVLVQLGQLNGVAGSTIAISDTLTGKISNMGDAWDQFSKTLGDQQSGRFRNAINNLTTLIALATEWAKTAEQVQQDTESQAAASAIDRLELMAEAYGSLEEAGRVYTKLLEFELGLQQDRNLKLISAAAKGDEAAEKEQKTVFNRIGLLKAEITAIRDYVANAKEKPKVIDKTTVSADKLAKAMKVLADEIDTAGIAQTDIGIFLDHVRKQLDEHFEEVSRQIDEQNDEEFQKLVDKNNRELEEIERRNELEKEGKEKLRDLAINVSNQGFELAQANIEREIALLNQKRDLEIENAGDNEEAKDQIRKKYAQRQAQLQAKQAHNEQQQAIFNLLVTQGPAVGRAFRDFPFPIAAGIALLVLAQFGLLLANTRKATPPKFARGKYNLDGPGTETSDSIPAWLSRGEDVVPAERNKKFGFFLKPIIEDESLTLLDVRNIIDRQLPSGYPRAIYYQTARGADSEEVLEELKATRKAMENLKQVHINVDPDGLKFIAKEGLQWTEYVNKRYSS